MRSSGKLVLTAGVSDSCPGFAMAYVLHLCELLYDDRQCQVHQYKRTEENYGVDVKCRPPRRGQDQVVLGLAPAFQRRDDEDSQVAFEDVVEAIHTRNRIVAVICTGQPFSTLDHSSTEF